MTKKFFIDMTERALTTFAEGWVAAWVLLDKAHQADLFSATNLKLGAGAGVLAVGKAIVASRIGKVDSASLSTKV